MLAVHIATAALAASCPANLANGPPDSGAHWVAAAGHGRVRHLQHVPADQLRPPAAVQGQDTRHVEESARPPYCERCEATS